VTGFPKFPNTSPSGKRVDSDDPIPQIFRKFSKKRHPRNVGGDTRRPGTLERLDRGRFAELPLPAPINRRLPLLKNFTAFLHFYDSWIFLARGISSSTEKFANFRFSSHFSKVLSYFSLSILTCHTLLQWYLCSMSFILECCSYWFVCLSLLVRWLELKALPDP
jgi:hypothetical protein